MADHNSRNGKRPGRKAKYKTREAAYQAKLAANKRWRERNPEKFRKMQARSYQRRKLAKL